MQQVALAALGFLIVALSIGQKVRERNNRRVAARHPWSPMHWPSGRATWRDEFQLWVKIASYSAVAGAIVALVLTH